ncbi:MAG TPA: hypothetical protein VL588_03300, partial [Bdellovibrionota bacterium]|nr:hypothetical protein [Bdellovibrionota bacterium]
TDELLSSLSCLLALNPSRREALARHLDALCGSATASYEAGALKRWVESDRTQAQDRALATFLEEVALTCLGQALLLKSWADRGLRPWTKPDLGRLNWTLSNSLKPFVPLSREGWQLTRPNLYSWYNPAPALQEEIWETLRRWDLADSGASLLTGLLRAGRRHAPSLPEIRGYDLRFFCSIWEKLSHFGARPEASPSALAERHAFSPTLRDGSMVRAAPPEFQWHGMESYPFQLLVAEMAELWHGPKIPPQWATGSGLEAHAREQLSLRLNNPKPNLVNRIAERENCEVGFVLEERCVRSGDRGSDATALREELDRLPYFKALRSDRSSLGTLQACLTLTKLRPGGLLWWAREAPLTRDDGMEGLRFLLDRGTLLCEWDFSGASSTLPSRVPLFSKYLYLFRREPRTDLRRSHRPQRVRVEGRIQSHAEVPRLLEEALASYRSSPTVELTLPKATSQGLAAWLEPAAGTQAPAPAAPAVNLSQWKIHHQFSPQPQQEWAERWPDAASQDALKRLDDLRTRALPLGQRVAVRPLTGKDHQALQEGGWARSGMTRQALVLSPDRSAPEGERRLSVQTADRGSDKGGFLLICPEAAWVGPLGAYLESAPVREWLDHYCERRRGQWALSEATVKLIPIPQSLADAIAGAPLPQEWTSRLEQIPYRPRDVQGSLTSERSVEVRAAVFTRAARALNDLRTTQARLFSLVDAQGAIRWAEFMRVLPRTEKVAFQLHPALRMSGSLPPHLPVQEIQPLKRPARGVLLATEGGLNLCVSCEDPFLMDMLWGQMEGLKHPTWNELTRLVELPRQTDLAQATANDVLRSHQEQRQRLAELQDLLAEAASAL